MPSESLLSWVCEGINYKIRANFTFLISFTLRLCAYCTLVYNTELNNQLAWLQILFFVFNFMQFVLQNFSIFKNINKWMNTPSHFSLCIQNSLTRRKNVLHILPSNLFHTHTIMMMIVNVNTKSRREKYSSHKMRCK